MRHRPTRRPATALAALLLGLTACGSSGGTSGGGSGLSIKLAVVGPMTGDAAADGLHIRQGAELAARQVNDGGGIATGRYRGARIEIQTFDDKETVDGSVSIANQVVSDDSYWAFLGTGFSDAAIATAPVLDRSNVAYLSTYASSDLIIRKPRHNVFVVPPTFPAYAFSAAERAHRLGFRRVAILEANAGFATHMADLFAQRFTALGGSVVVTRQYTLGDRNVEGPVAGVRAASPAPDLVAMAGLTGDDVAQLHALHAAGVTVPVIDLEAVLFSQSFLQSAGADAAGVIGQTPSDPARSTPPSRALRDAFRSAYGTDIIPDPAAFTYEGVLAIARALEASPDGRTQLAGALHRLSLADTGVGSLSFDPTGARLGGVLWYFTVVSGAFHFDTGYRQTAPMAVTEVKLEE